VKERLGTVQKDLGNELRARGFFQMMNLLGNDNRQAAVKQTKSDKYLEDMISFGNKNTGKRCKRNLKKRWY